MSPAVAGSPSGAVPVGDLAAVDRAIAALDGQRAVLGDDVVDTALAPLRERRGQLAAGQLTEQRKLVSVLFADLVDFTVLSRELDPEDTRSVVDACFARWHSAIEAEGGVVEKFIGDAAMAVFGLQRSWEDDAERAVRAGLAMTAATAELAGEVRDRYGVALHMRVGVDTGEVVVSTFGERPGHEFVAVGPTVNRASRLQSAAPVDRVLVSTETYRQVRGAFNVEALTGLQLKGIDRPVDAYVVGTPRPRAFRLDRGGALDGLEAETVGREAELAFLRDRLAETAARRRWQLVTVVGDAGVGKSRLLRDFDLWMAGSTDAFWGFRGRASHAGQNHANALTRDVVATRMEIQDSDPPDVVRAKLEAGFALAFGPGAEARRAADLVGPWLGFDLGPTGVTAETGAPAASGEATATDELGELAPPAEPLASGTSGGAALPTDPRSVRDQATLTLGRYFARLADSAPVVVLLEDLHWADATSLRLLASADALWRDSPLLVVATTRPTFLHDHPDWDVEAATGDRDAQVRLDLGPLSDEQSRALVRDLLRRVGEPPESLVQLVVGSAEGNPFYVEELVTWLVETGVVVPGTPRWEVVPELLGQVVVPPSLKGLLQARLDALSSVERAVLQRASVVGRVFWDDAVAHLETGPIPSDGDGALFDLLRERDFVHERELSAFDSAREFLFKHALLRDVAYDSVLRTRRQQYHARAAGWLADVSARYGRAEEYASIVALHYDRARDPAAAEWYLRAGRRAARVFSLDEAGSLLDRAADIAPADQPDLRFEIVSAREELRERRGDREGQEADLREMTALSEAIGDPSVTVTTLLARSRRSFEASAYPAAVALAREAAQTAGRAGLAGRVAEALLWAGKALVWDERSDEAERELLAARDAGRESGRGSVVAEALRYLAMLASNEGRYDDAIDYGASSIAEFSGTGDLEAQSTALVQHGVTLFNLGLVDEAKDAFERALPVFQTSGHVYRQAVAIGNLAAVALLLGDLADARDLSATATDMMVGLGDKDSEAVNQIIRASVDVWTHHWPEAEERLGVALHTIREIRSAALAVEAETWLVLGGLEYQPGDPGLVDRARGLVADADRAGVPPQPRGRAYLALGYALLERAADGDAAEASEVLARAAAMEGPALEAVSLEARVALLAADPAGAGDVADRLDRRLVDLMFDAPTALLTLRNAVRDNESQRDRVDELAREYLQRRREGSRDSGTAAGFLAVPSVARLAAAL